MNDTLSKVFIKIALALRSKTVLTVIAMFIYNGLSSVKDLVPLKYQDAVNVALTMLAAYFRVNPSEKLNNSIKATDEK